MTWEFIVVSTVVAALLLYVLRHFPKALKDLKRELGGRE